MLGGDALANTLRCKQALGQLPLVSEWCLLMAWWDANRTVIHREECPLQNYNVSLLSSWYVSGGFCQPDVGTTLFILTEETTA